MALDKGNIRKLASVLNTLHYFVLAIQHRATDISICM